jgi:hypothetical protein
MRFVRLLRQSAEHVHHFRVERLEERYEYGPDAVAGEPRVGVRGVGAEGLAEAGEVVKDFGAGDSEKGANDPRT